MDLHYFLEYLYNLVPLQYDMDPCKVTVPLDEKHPQTITASPLYLTVGAIAAGIISSDVCCTYVCLFELKN